MHEDSVRSQLGKLPRGPGVYLFRGDRDDVLYVGKAKSLRARVRSYFNRGSDMRVGIDRMVDRIRRIEMRLSEETSKGLTLVLPFYSRLAAYEMTGKPFDAFMPDLFDGLPALGTDR